MYTCTHEHHQKYSWAPNAPTFIGIQIDVSNILHCQSKHWVFSSIEADGDDSAPLSSLVDVDIHCSPHLTISLEELRSSHHNVLPSGGTFTHAQDDMSPKTQQSHSNVLDLSCLWLHSQYVYAVCSLFELNSGLFLEHFVWAGVNTVITGMCREKQPVSGHYQANWGVVWFQWKHDSTQLQEVIDQWKILACNIFPYSHPLTVIFFFCFA